MKTEELMHSNGTTAYETFSVIVPSAFLIFITSSLTIKFSNQTVINRLIFEFNVIVVSIILIVTVLADYATDITILLIIMCIALLGMFRCNDIKNPPKHSKYLNYLTIARSTINIISIIGILAVDFQIFPRRFTKTKDFGYSLMDVGVGLFVFANGIVAQEIRDVSSSISKAVKGTIPLIVLGSARFIVTNQLDYNVPVSEYGVHWNFFITLAAVKILSSLILSIVPASKSLLIGTFILLVHEIILQLGVGKFVLSNVARSTFFKANREGLVSSSGYLGLYFLSLTFGRFLKIYAHDKSKKNGLKLCLISVFLLWATLLINKNFGVSRRLANSGYCIWILFIGVCMVTIFYLSEVIQNFVYGCNHIPLIFEAINYNGLPFFLVANLLTGGINMICDTMSVDSLQSCCIIIVYMMINCGLSYILFTKKIKIKL